MVDKARFFSPHIAVAGRYHPLVRRILRMVFYGIVALAGLVCVAVAALTARSFVIGEDELVLRSATLFKARSAHGGLLFSIEPGFVRGIDQPWIERRAYPYRDFPGMYHAYPDVD